MNDYKKTFTSYVELVNSRLDVLLPKDGDIVAKAMRYSIENGGKRIRPILVLSACKMCGGDVSQALDFACALEMIHTYSLIHDDLPCMDNDDMRRGKPSCHVKFGEEYALLAGDALLTFAFETASKANTDDRKKALAICALSESAGISGMVGGQVIDLQSEGKEITYDTMKKMHSMKTGALIRCAVKLGCICANADEKTTASLVRYAENIGYAFQAVDDILDVTSTQEVLGKPIGSDEECQKTTYVTLFGVEKAKKIADELTKNAIESIGQYENNEFLVALAKELTDRKY